MQQKYYSHLHMRIELHDGPTPHTYPQSNIAKLSTKNPTERKASTQSSSRVGLPDSLDWRNTDLVTKIKNQYNCGACWAFAGAAAAETKLIDEGR